MNKRLVFSALLMFSSVFAFSGGILENTNQSINFLRNPARDAAIGTDGVYSNPAGVVFLPDGWHFQFNWMMTHQDRDTQTGYTGNSQYDLFNYNINNDKLSPLNEDGQRSFDGNVNVPIQPSLFLAYNKNKWSFQFGFGFIGGGGGCKFEDGLGSFEALAANTAMSYLSTLQSLGMMDSNLMFAGYGGTSFMKGTSFDFGFTLGAVRELAKGLSGYVGLRGLFLMNCYEGHLNNMQLRTLNPSTGALAVMDIPMEYVLDCTQHGFGIAPIIGIDYKPNEHWNFAAKCEFKTKLTAKTKSKNNETFEQLAPLIGYAAYTDGAESFQDLPTYLTAGVQYSPIQALRISGGYHHYFDQDARQYNKDIVGDTNEMNFGVEYDINNTLEVSGGMQKTWYKLDDSFQSDASFILGSYSLGCGVGINVSKKVKLNLAYFQTIYKDKQVKTAMNIVNYRRTNRLLGLGIDVSF